MNGRPEQAEFPIDCPAQDVKGKDCLNIYISSNQNCIDYFFNQMYNILLFKKMSFFMCTQKYNE